MFRSCVSCAENIIKKLSELAESEFGIDFVIYVRGRSSFGNIFKK